MRKHLIFTLFICSILLTGCARYGATYRVLDAQTKEPVEGAVAIAWWSSYRGLPGLTYGVTDKVVEAETGADGTFRIPAIYGRIAMQVPRLKVYKPGYVGWDNRYVYLGCYKENIKLDRYKKREGFKYKSQDIYLEHWKDEYSYISHGHFLDRHVPGDLHRIGLTGLKYDEAIRYEVPLKVLERKSLKKKGGNK